MASNNREYQKAYLKRHYEANKQYYVRKAREGRQRKIEYIRLKKNVPCTDCGQRYPFYVMDFDHRPEHRKELRFNDQALFASFARIDAEIAKCDVVCANCHRRRTYSRLEDKKRIKPSGPVAQLDRAPAF